MPLLEITLPKVETDIKENLCRKLTDTFTESSRFEAEIFGVCFHEYNIGQAGRGGKIWDGQNGQPYIHMVLHIARIDRNSKQRLVENLTQTFLEVIGKKNWMPVIHIYESPFDNVGVDGQLLSDQYEECTKSKFYYEVIDK